MIKRVIVKSASSIMKHVSDIERKKIEDQMDATQGLSPVTEFDKSDYKKKIKEYLRQIL